MVLVLAWASTEMLGTWAVWGVARPFLLGSGGLETFESGPSAEAEAETEEIRVVGTEDMQDSQPEAAAAPNVRPRMPHVGDFYGPSRRLPRPLRRFRSIHRTQRMTVDLYIHLASPGCASASAALSPE